MIIFSCTRVSDAPGVFVFSVSAQSRTRHPSGCSPALDWQRGTLAALLPQKIVGARPCPAVTEYRRVGYAMRVAVGLKDILTASTPLMTHGQGVSGLMRGLGAGGDYSGTRARVGSSPLSSLPPPPISYAPNTLATANGT